MQKCRWHVFPDTKALKKQAVKEIVKAADEAIAQRGVFNLVLAGGTTPRAVYEKLRDIKTDWSAWYIYFGDERCLPANHPDRNSVMALTAWLNYATVPHCQIFIIPAEQGSTMGAEAYSKLLNDVTFDLVLLGLGEDGHTASLFPGHDPGLAPDAPVAQAVHDAPKPPSERISLSARCLSDAKKVIYLVTGESKRLAVSDWRSGKPIPASLIAPKKGVDILLEEACLAP
ncbi:6-phosphogluconolactonase [Sulfurirhabdus autotrophica]|uniref:6-phosphogluconolactonase n=1 Tax=Sulfurirhabdus autotrophica TaxID=1706046 RepID=A0A4R3YAG3_9PROT|nr:6-phosphogluconolactonase [Sulfurirhabdus autotrophica]TCV88936.1 6-phosphogluconolactonase [Sulfurirhabdus autotrophica]